MNFYVSGRGYYKMLELEINKFVDTDHDDMLVYIVLRIFVLRILNIVITRT